MRVSLLALFVSVTGIALPGFAAAEPVRHAPTTAPGYSAVSDLSDAQPLEAVRPETVPNTTPTHRYLHTVALRAQAEREGKALFARDLILAEHPEWADSLFPVVARARNEERAPALLVGIHMADGSNRYIDPATGLLLQRRNTHYANFRAVETDAPLTSPWADLAW